MSRITDLIAFHEGYRGTCYKDTKDFWTWGYGWCLETRPLTMPEAMEICQLAPGDYSPEWLLVLPRLMKVLDGLQEREKYLVARFMLDKEIKHATQQLPNKIPCWENLNEVRQAALTDLSYNMGIQGLLGFRNTLLSVCQSAWDDAARRLLDSTYARETKTRAIRIAKMLKTGKWPDDVPWSEDASK